MFLVPVAMFIAPKEIASGNAISFMTNFAFYAIFSAITSTALNKIMYTMAYSMEAESAINRIEQIMDAPQIVETKNPMMPKDSSIEFRNVSFRYSEDENYAIKNVSFRVEKGKTLALVGHSGGGKTTIARLISRFWDVTSGEILIGGVNVKDISTEVLMEKVSFVFQDCKLFKASIYENVRCAKKDATREEVVKALEMAQCLELIKRLPYGIDTVIGSKGTFLSGGEQQRIAIARAILKDASIIVLDEATAFSDPENEVLIQKALPIILSILLFAVCSFITHLQQYIATYGLVYGDVKDIRIGLAESLRKLPLAFFGKKDLSDLTETVMSDVNRMEHVWSHVLPYLYGAYISTFIIGIGMMICADIDDYEKKLRAGEFSIGIFVNIASVVMRLGVATTILLGANLIVKGQIDFMIFFGFILAITRIYTPFDQCLALLSELFLSEISAERLRNIYDEVQASRENKFEPQGHDIKFENVSFSYDDDVVLDHVSFTAKEGEVTALVGPSGSGKSTCARLAARLWDVSGGIIEVGGVDILKVEPETLHRDYSMVFQNVLLFDDTIMENIRIGKHGASDEEVMQAARLANCDEFVKNMKDGYNTIIGENGEKLSGGERQRISIARAILKDAPIVFLDEATASLDVENESKVQEALSRLLKGKTVLVIAHRMRTVEAADKIIVLKNGKIVEEGKPSELMKDEHGEFNKMLNLQMNQAQWSV